MAVNRPDLSHTIITIENLTGSDIEEIRVGPTAIGLIGTVTRFSTPIKPDELLNTHEAIAAFTGFCVIATAYDQISSRIGVILGLPND
jgi:hypothetical protein